MSTDLYLLPSRFAKLDTEDAVAFIEQDSLRSDAIDERCENRKRKLAALLKRMKPSYQEFSFDFEEIARFEKITIEQARSKYRHIELNGNENPAEAQFLIHDNHIDIHWYSGTSPQEMDAILYALGVSGDYVLFDPQQGEIVDLRED